MQVPCLCGVKTMEEIKEVPLDSEGHWYPHIFLFDAMGIASEF